MSESWKAKADALVEGLASTTSGGRMLRIERVAREQGLSQQTAQHLLRARSFLDRLSADNQEAAKRVQALSYQSLIALERWYARDREQMLTYLADNPEPSVRQLTAAEKASRGSLRAAEPAAHAIDVLTSIRDPILPGKALSKMMKWSGIELFDLKALSWEAVSAEYERALGVEFSAAAPQKCRVALLVGPASQTSGHYNRHAKSVWYNAVCATTLFSLVIVLLPSKAAQAACLTSMPLPPNCDGGWPDWNTQTAARGSPRSGPIRPASPAGGIIVFTAPERIHQDWRT